MIESGFLLWYLFLALTLAVVAFFAGRHSNKDTLDAAAAVSEVTKAFVNDTNLVTSTLDKVHAEIASLRVAVDNVGGSSIRNMDVLEAGLRDVETLVERLFVGFEEAGVVRKPRAGPGRQVGEASPE